MFQIKQFNNDEKKQQQQEAERQIQQKQRWM